MNDARELALLRTAKMAKLAKQMKIHLHEVKCWCGKNHNRPSRIRSP